MTEKISANFRCQICGGNETSGNYKAREMMLGLRMVFHYSQCGECGTLWLTDPPADFAPYYPSQYYSFAESAGLRKRAKDYLRKERDRTYFGKGNMVGRFVASQCGDEALLSVSKLNIRRDARILDVGCGSGKLLRRMAAFGFDNLTGIDPFLSNEIHDGPRLQIRKCRLEDLAGEKYDLVMFHHSLEHMADPGAALRAAAELLTEGGKCLVRLPVVAYAWDKYGTNWVQLDPPRHIWVPTEKAMRMLAGSAGFRVEFVEYDSTGLQFWGSELYSRDVPFKDGGAGNFRFQLGRLAEFRVMAEALNRNARGDQSVFLLG